jgi:hypothetical protein
MEPTADPYCPEALLRSVARENADLRELLSGVARELERLACEHPAMSSRLLARAMRLRHRLHRAGS